MVSANVAHNVVGIIGNVISFGLFLSPAPTFMKIIKNKAVEEFSPVPYMATVLNCMLWVFYGMPFVHPDSLLVVTINSVGLGLELIYLAIFFLYADNKGRRKVSLGLLGIAAFFSVVAVVTLLKFHNTKNRSLIVGIICDVFNIIMYASPLTIMFTVIRTKSVRYMPFTLSLANLLNGIIWTSYALIKFDIYILVSNGLGSFFGVIQLVLYGIYYFFGVKDDHQKVEKKQSEIELADV